MRRFWRLAAPATTSARGSSAQMALGWIWMHESGTYVKFTDAGAALFA